MTQRRNKPEPTEALVERVREGIFARDEDETTKVRSAAALTELTERLTFLENEVLTAKRIIADASELRAAVERERDEWKETARRESEGWQLAVDRGRALDTLEARVKELEEALRYVDEHESLSDAARERIDAALSQVREEEAPVTPSYLPDDHPLRPLGEP